MFSLISCSIISIYSTISFLTFSICATSDNMKLIISSSWYLALHWYETRLHTILFLQQSNNFGNFIERFTVLFNAGDQHFNLICFTPFAWTIWAIKWNVIINREFSLDDWILSKTTISSRYILTKYCMNKPSKSWCSNSPTNKKDSYILYQYSFSDWV